MVLDGEIDHGEASPFALMDFERDEGFILACTATLKSDVDDRGRRRGGPRRPPHRGARLRRRGRRALDSLTHDVKGVRLALEGDGIDFQAGQYVMVKLPGVEGARAFSIANAPSNANEIELQVRRVPGGAGTGYVHETLKLGDRVAFQRPLWPLRRAQVARRSAALSRRRHRRVEPARDDPRPARTGLRRADHARARRPDRSRSLWPRRVRGAGGETRRISATCPALSSEPEGSAWTGERGFVHDVAKRLYGGEFAGKTAYLCGPPPMIEACLGALMQGRLFEKHIFTEQFFTAQDAGAKPKSPLFKRL